MTVGHPIAIGSAPPQASKTWSPWRAADRFPITTVVLPFVTKPGPCGGIGTGSGQMWMSERLAIDAMTALAAAAVAALIPSV